MPRPKGSKNGITKTHAEFQVGYRKKRRSIIHNMKKTLSCVYCGISNPLCIDFDHIDRKTKLCTLATMITGGYKWQDVLDEIKKCQPVCRNCHQIKSVLESNKLSYLEDDLTPYIPHKLLTQFSSSPSITKKINL